MIVGAKSGAKDHWFLSQKSNGEKQKKVDSKQGGNEGRWPKEQFQENEKEKKRKNRGL